MFISLNYSTFSFVVWANVQVCNWSRHYSMCGPSLVLLTIWNRTKPRALVQSTHKGVNQRSKDVTQAQLTTKTRVAYGKLLPGMRVNARPLGDSGPCCCVCVTPFERWLTPLCVDIVNLRHSIFRFNILPLKVCWRFMCVCVCVCVCVRVRVFCFRVREMTTTHRVDILSSWFSPLITNKNRQL